MRNKFRALLAAVALIGFAAGCATSSHKSVRTYEYDENPPPERQEESESGSDYEMTSPGEMVVE